MVTSRPSVSTEQVETKINILTFFPSYLPLGSFNFLKPSECQRARETIHAHCESPRTQRLGWSWTGKLEVARTLAHLNEELEENSKHILEGQDFYVFSFQLLFSTVPSGLYLQYQVLPLFWFSESLRRNLNFFLSVQTAQELSKIILILLKNHVEKYTLKSILVYFP